MASRARTVRRRIGMRGIAARGRGECKSWGWPRPGWARALLLPLRRQGEIGRGWPWFGLIRKAPLPNPPLPSQGRGPKLAAWAAPTRSRSRKGGEVCFVPHSPFPPLTLDRVVHLVLERMRRGAERGDFLHLQPDVGVDEVVGHHAAGLEELAVGVEGFERLVDRVAHGRNVLFLFGRPVVQVLVAGAARVELVLDAVKARHQDRKSVVLGKSVSVRVNLGGRRSIKKKKK